MLLAETSPQICPEPDPPLTPKLVVNARIDNAANPNALYGQTVEARWTTINPTTYPSIITGIHKPGYREAGIAYQRWRSQRFHCCLRFC